MLGSAPSGRREVNVPKVVSHLRRLRRELEVQENRDITVLEVAQATGLSRNRLTSLELGKFDRVDNDELIALSAYYTKGLGRPIAISDMLEIAPNNKKAFGQVNTRAC